MNSIDETHIDAIKAACSENAAKIAESINLCFDRQYRLEAGESSAWNADEVADDLDGPGLTVALHVGQNGLLCLIPESLPLPDWYRAASESENARLQTLSQEWATVMLPEDLEAERFLAVDCDNLKQQVVDSQPANWAASLELLVYEQNEETAGDSADEAVEPTPVAKLFVISAVDQPPLPERQDSTATDEGTNATETGANSVSPQTVSAPLDPVDRRMMDLPVKVSVRLAEKKIELGQLASITPGGLVTFNKESESLLDLYVNNHLYGRGEAIKIGEKFGLKVTQVGVKQERPRRVL